MPRFDATRSNKPQPCSTSSNVAVLSGRCTPAARAPRPVEPYGHESARRCCELGRHEGHPELGPAPAHLRTRIADYCVELRCLPGDTGRKKSVVGYLLSSSGACWFTVIVVSVTGRSRLRPLSLPSTAERLRSCRLRYRLPATLEKSARRIRRPTGFAPRFLDHTVRTSLWPNDAALRPIPKWPRSPSS